jgi:hypothetical protein
MTTSTYSNLSVLQGFEPPTSATNSVSLPLNHISRITMVYGQTLRKLGKSTQRRMILETYSQKKTRLDISSNTPDYEEAQEEEITADSFCVWDEINYYQWKENEKGKHKDNVNWSDDEYGCS